MRPQSPVRKLILASSSPYRKSLLERLRLPFEATVPAVDESPQPGESAQAMVARLAARKAAVIAAQNPAAVVIGSDQVAVYRGRIVGKPGTVERAREQLAEFSGQSVAFLTAVSVQCEETGLHYDRTVGTEVTFRSLARDEIERYVELDRPLDCAGAFRAEAAGSALFRRLRSDDPTAIVGLPLIAVAAALREAGFAVP
ncbi:MAG: Maf family nucleotide pyrophosphatase [Xanthomonadales bacterium]|nr:Maf family nucleotide pyrophosphatase [Xanthomonadales bacterium]